ncbi:MAG: 50S ribosomal protein L11, partial [Sphingobacteriia bacterium]|nr:50S ribosomal protein L11 [Sphingobacteriia bacterium]
AKIKAGSPTSNRKKVGSLSWDQVKTIAEDKIVDMNCFTIESAMSMVAGTARSMGVTVTGERPSAN